MSGGKQLLDQIQIDLRNDTTGDILPVYIDVYDSSLSRKWLTALNNLLHNNYHLEKNYCFFGFPFGPRNAQYLLDQINLSISSINKANLGYQIDDYFTIDNTIYPGNNYHEDTPDGFIIHDKLNWLHRYFEDLQGTSGCMSEYYNRADASTKWHIRQLNLLCHEYESLVLSMRKVHTAPEWIRPSQLMCWLNAPRFTLEYDDYELFGVETINRPVGGVFMGVNKAVGKHHWEVFNDEGRDVNELISTSLSSQTEGAGDFDIEWGMNPSGRPWQIAKLEEFNQWLISNGFDPSDKSLTIGHPQVGQVDLERSFNTTDCQKIWDKLNCYLNVYSIRTGAEHATYPYNWSDSDFIRQQIELLGGNK